MGIFFNSKSIYSGDNKDDIVSIVIESPLTPITEDANVTMKDGNERIVIRFLDGTISGHSDTPRVKVRSSDLPNGTFVDIWFSPQTKKITIDKKSKATWDRIDGVHRELILYFLEKELKLVIDTIRAFDRGDKDADTKKLQLKADKFIPSVIKKFGSVSKFKRKKF